VDVVRHRSCALLKSLILESDPMQATALQHAAIHYGVLLWHLHLYVTGIVDDERSHDTVPTSAGDRDPYPPSPSTHTSISLPPTPGTPGGLDHMSSTAHDSARPRGGGSDAGGWASSPVALTWQLREGTKDLITLLCIGNDLSYEVMSRALPVGIVCMRCATLSEDERSRIVQPQADLDPAQHNWRDYQAPTRADWASLIASLPSPGGLSLGGADGSPTKGGRGRGTVRDIWFGPKIHGKRSLPPGQSWRAVVDAISQDWVTPELLWNGQTRAELLAGLEREVSKLEYVRSGKGQGLVPWDLRGFEVEYPCYRGQLLVHGYFVELLVDSLRQKVRDGPGTPARIKDPVRLLLHLMDRCVVEESGAWKAMCLRAMRLLIARHPNQLAGLVPIRFVLAEILHTLTWHRGVHGDGHGGIPSPSHYHFSQRGSSFGSPCRPRPPPEGLGLGPGEEGEGDGDEDAGDGADARAEGPTEGDGEFGREGEAGEGEGEGAPVVLGFVHEAEAGDFLLTHPWLRELLLIMLASLEKCWSWRAGVELVREAIRQDGFPILTDLLWYAQSLLINAGVRQPSHVDSTFFNDIQSEVTVECGDEDEDFIHHSVFALILRLLEVMTRYTPAAAHALQQCQAFPRLVALAWPLAGGGATGIERVHADELALSQLVQLLDRCLHLFPDIRPHLASAGVVEYLLAASIGESGQGLMLLDTAGFLRRYHLPFQGAGANSSLLIPYLPPQLVKIFAEERPEIVSRLFNSDALKPDLIWQSQHRQACFRAVKNALQPSLDRFMDHPLDWPLPVEAPATMDAAAVTACYEAIYPDLAARPQVMLLFLEEFLVSTPPTFTRLLPAQEFLCQLLSPISRLVRDRLPRSKYYEDERLPQDGLERAKLLLQVLLHLVTHWPVHGSMWESVAVPAICGLMDWTLSRDASTSATERARSRSATGGSPPPPDAGARAEPEADEESSEVLALRLSILGLICSVFLQVLDPFNKRRAELRSASADSMSHSGSISGSQSQSAGKVGDLAAKAGPETVNNEVSSRLVVR
jgi:hypothetical protein